jgi:hypothetical protein
MWWISVGFCDLFLKETAHPHEGARACSWRVVEARHKLTSHMIQSIWSAVLAPVIKFVICLLLR